MYHSHVYTLSGDYVGYIRHNGIVDLMSRYPADKHYWSKHQDGVEGRFN
jgi:hypothetical protein